MLKHLIRNRRVLALLALTTAVIAVSSVAAFASDSVLVKVGDKWFRAKTVTIHTGGKITWQWVGHLYHNVTEKSGPVKFQHSKTQARGTYSHIFTRRGTYHLYCTLHPGMTMTVYVK